ncbi:3-oxoacyl-[acyl-carrier protein] reductase [Rathayibacter oskolensis]|uniref:3-oxoacyl-[acyl-carrier protein] reductase n=1 Tax=Rathayibacter oskolensis TaxID=1891671 RepID=A0A1X7PHU8_9MICO|nr:SDR family NAD(P)-dependent oxidoreductase [Rathayibacter oskolensis]SMH51048.1 3-oxoacyl-[acyl-carrier protein] reductase [Rathayibacter oskolensis]
MSLIATAPLAGRIALVTGAGRPRGIGRSIALALADAGADVVVTDVGRARADLEVGGAGLGDDPADLEESAALVRRRGRRSLAVGLDVTDEEAVSAAIDRVRSEWGVVDVLVNNAGTGVGTGPFLDVTDAQLGVSWQVNVLGQVHLARAVLPGMIDAGRGSIVNIASTMGLAAAGGYGGYVLAKHAIVGLTRLLAHEFGGRGIRTNAVAPGYIFTDLGEAELRLTATRLGIDEGTALEAMLSEIPLGRAGTPEDIGAAVAWLAGDGAGFVNGAVLPVTGGQPAGLN